MAENNDRAGTPYKVLIPAVGSETGEPHPGAWNEVDGTYTAPNDVAAIKLAEAAHGPFDHGAIAVPARSWRPRTPTDKIEKRRTWA